MPKSLWNSLALKSVMTKPVPSGGVVVSSVLELKGQSVGGVAGGVVRHDRGGDGAVGKVGSPSNVPSPGPSHNNITVAWLSSESSPLTWRRDRRPQP